MSTITTVIPSLVNCIPTSVTETVLSVNGGSVLTVTTTISVPPFTTNEINFWPVSVGSTDSTEATIYPLQTPSHYPVFEEATTSKQPLPTVWPTGSQTLTLHLMPTVSVSLPPKTWPSVTGTPTTTSKSYRFPSTVSVKHGPPKPHQTCTQNCGSKHCELFGCSGGGKKCGLFGCDSGCGIFGCGGGCGFLNCGGKSGLCPLNKCGGPGCMDGKCSPGCPGGVCPPVPSDPPGGPPDSPTSCEMTMTATNIFVSCTEVNPTSTECTTTATSVTTGCQAHGTTTATTAFPSCPLVTVSPDDYEGDDVDFTPPGGWPFQSGPRVGPQPT
ncbi:hypothetical protein BU16DRAFT_564119 [Lophium mytilinum]|uniref:Uncharacterized protein n=1 Tax=Lophium mytilinum TaxID=390894 RepID=A0A6A6QL30_9PEZI|nr:hypothetical protein BU16DRAFT_564119 [Lophium mytilinum]